MTDNTFNRQQLADNLHISVRTLDRWHRLRKGPPRITVGKMVCYREEAVKQWLINNETHPLNSGETNV